MTSSPVDVSKLEAALERRVADLPWTDLPCAVEEPYMEEDDALLAIAAVNALPDLLAEVTRSRALVRAVEALHRRAHVDIRVACGECGKSWPCPTAAAVGAALNPRETGR